MKLHSTVTNKVSIKTYNKLPSRIAQIHGDKYDYSLFTFKGVKDSSTLRCNTGRHPDWETSMDKHLNGKLGCPLCALEKKIKPTAKLYVEYQRRLGLGILNAVHTYCKFKKPPALLLIGKLNKRLKNEATKKQQRKEVKRLSDKKYRENNKERLAAKNKAWRNKDIEAYRKSERERRSNRSAEEVERQRLARQEYNKANSAKVKQAKRESRLRHIEKAKATCKRYRESAKGQAIAKEARAKYTSKKKEVSDGTVTGPALKALMEDQRHRCKYCDNVLTYLKPKYIHLDHVFPISKGGLHTINNVVWSCASCNLSKSSSTDYSFHPNQQTAAKDYVTVQPTLIEM